MSEGYHGVYIGNVDCQSSVEEIRSIFSHCGEIVDCKLGGDPMKQFRYAFVNFTTAAAREEAMKLDGYRHLKYDLTVRHSTSTPRFPRNHQDRYSNNYNNNNNNYGGGGYGMGPSVAQPLPPPPANPQIIQQLHQLMAMQAQGQPIDQAQLANLVATLSTPGGVPSAGAAAPVQRDGPRGNWVPACEDRPSESVLQYRAAQKQQYMQTIRNLALEYEKKMIKKQDEDSGGSSQSSSSSSGSDSEGDGMDGTVVVANKKQDDTSSSIGSISNDDSDSDEDEEKQKEKRLKAAMKAALKFQKTDKKSKKHEKKKEKKDKKKEKKDKKQEKKEKKDKREQEKSAVNDAEEEEDTVVVKAHEQEEDDDALVEVNSFDDEP